MAISSAAVQHTEKLLEYVMIHAIARVLEKHVALQSPAELTWIVEEDFVNTNSMNMAQKYWEN